MGVESRGSDADWCWLRTAHRSKHTASCHRAAATCSATKKGLQTPRCAAHNQRGGRKSELASSIEQKDEITAPVMEETALTTPPVRAALVPRDPAQAGTGADPTAISRHLFSGEHSWRCWVTGGSCHRRPGIQHLGLRGICEQIMAQHAGGGQLLPKLLPERSVHPPALPLQHAVLIPTVSGGEGPGQTARQGPGAGDQNATVRSGGTE